MVTFLWQDTIWRELVVGTALAVDTLVPDPLGGALPTVLKQFRLEPTLVSCLR
ncbi:hypothetical protein ACFL0S_03285 [Thermodesulfobacteriota bacterium]